MSSRPAPNRTEQDTNWVARTVPGTEGTLRVHSGVQAVLLAALGTLSTLLTLAYYLASHPPLVLLVVVPLWSLWLLSFVDWLRGDVLTWPPNTAATEDSGQKLELVRRSEASPTRSWADVALARPSGE